MFVFFLFFCSGCQSTRTVSLCISSEDEQELSGDKGKSSELLGCKKNTYMMGVQ